MLVGSSIVVMIKWQGTRTMRALPQCEIHPDEDVDKEEVCDQAQTGDGRELWGGAGEEE